MPHRRFIVSKSKLAISAALLALAISAAAYPASFAAPAAPGKDQTAETDIRDIRGPAPLRLEKRPFPWLPVLLGLAAGYLIWRRVTRKDSDQGPAAPKEPEKPRIPPDIVALAAFDELFRSDALRERRFKDWYTAVSRILRVYLGDSLGFNCVDLYNFEIMDELRRRKVNWADIDELDEILGECDLVKFARFVPNEIEAVEILGKAVEMVKKTGGGKPGC